MVLKIWFYENHEKTRKKAKDHQKTIFLSEEYKLLANRNVCE